LFVVLNELIDLPANDLSLVGLLTRGNPPFEEIPVDFGNGGPGPLLDTPNRRLGRVAITEHLEPDKFVDVTGR
jgi:hypothetical protein